MGSVLNCICNENDGVPYKHKPPTKKKTQKKKKLKKPRKESEETVAETITKLSNSSDEERDKVDPAILTIDEMEFVIQRRDQQRTYTIEEELSSLSQSSFLSLGGRIRSKSFHAELEGDESTQDDPLSSISKFAANTPMLIPQVKEAFQQILDERQYGEIICPCQLIKIRNLLSGNLLSSHFIKYETGSKMQEVSGVTIWKQEDDLEDEYDLWSFEPLKEDQLKLVGSLLGQPEESSKPKNVLRKVSSVPLEHVDADKSTTISMVSTKPQVMIGRIKHSLSGKYLGSNAKFLSENSHMQQVYCAMESLKTPLQDLVWKIDIQDQKEMRDGCIVRIEHLASGCYLHSHKMQAAIKGNCEVVGSKKDGLGDYWIIEQMQEEDKEIRESITEIDPPVENFLHCVEGIE